MKMFIIIIGLCFHCICADLGGYDPTKPRKMCNDMQGEDSPKSWGPHNVLPNLYEHIYKPFLNAFTYTAVCEKDAMTPIKCDQVLRMGSLQDRCYYIGASSMLVQYSILIHYLMEWNIYNWYPLEHNPNSDDTFMLLKECGNVIRKGDAQYHPYNECLRSTLAYQCVWNNFLWLSIPVIIVLICILLFLSISIFSACMLAIE